MFSIGVGPSSSHTVGPMRAARAFAESFTDLTPVARVKSELFGSLALTGEGHGTPKAILLGLEGNTPEGVDPDIITHRVIDIRTKNRLNFGGKKEIHFENSDLQLLKTKILPYHSNGMRFTAYDYDNNVIRSEVYYSIGGGFIRKEEEMMNPNSTQTTKRVPRYLYHTGRDLLAQCDLHKLSIAQLQMANEIAFGRTEAEVREGLLHIWEVMDKCIDRGLNSKEVILPGGLNVKRRAPRMYQLLERKGMSEQHTARATERSRVEALQKGRVDANDIDPSGHILDWVSVYALAVNEENAAGGRVVTAPTNGAAGVIPAVLRYYVRWIAKDRDAPATKDAIVEFLLTAGVIGIIAKKAASISAAEVGCQGEIGVASCMAAGALAALYGGTPRQIEDAAEIAMEHHLGMTCDPVGGLVQIPCIERNTMGSIKAINAARLALMGDGDGHVHLDEVLATMHETGKAMKTQYKETSLGGLAINVADVEC